jgi:hypothetical protein
MASTIQSEEFIHRSHDKVSCETCETINTFTNIPTKEMPLGEGYKSPEHIVELISRAKTLMFSLIMDKIDNIMRQLSLDQEIERELETGDPIITCYYSPSKDYTVNLSSGKRSLVNNYDIYIFYVAIEDLVDKFDICREINREYERKYPGMGFINVREINTKIGDMYIPGKAFIIHQHPARTGSAYEELEKLSDASEYERYPWITKDTPKLLSEK